MIKSKVHLVLKGRVKDYGQDFKTAIIKDPTHELIVSENSIEGDEVNNFKHHGGNTRVIHHYSEVHYAYLKQTFPEIADRFVPGSFGENIYTHELSEEDFCIGDIFNLGSTKIQLTASRRPCATINFSYKDQRILKEIMKSGRTGWFYRVLKEGTIKAGDVLEQVERPFPNLLLKRLHVEGYGQNGEKDLGFLKACLDSGMMDKGWKPALEKLFI
jgi:MOSC domain-containing protein YiiM